MKLERYNILVAGVIVTVLSCIALWSGIAIGQERKYPNKPIEVIVPFPAGGPIDVVTRILSDPLSKELGVPISIQYKAGAGGVIGSSYVATQKPDGYTLLSHTYITLLSASLLEKEPPYNPLKDFTPIVAYARVPAVLLNHSSSNLTSFDAVVKFAKEKPGALNCSSAGIGTTAHFVLEVLKMYGVDITHVPAKGAALAVTALLGKHVDLASPMYSAAVPHVKSGALRLLATTHRISEEPGVPTFKEKGFPEGEAFSSWLSFMGPPHLPKPIQDHLASAIRKVVQMASVKKALEDTGHTMAYMGSDELSKIMPEQYKSLETIVKAAGLGKYAK